MFTDNYEADFILERCIQCDYFNIENVFTEEKLYKVVKGLKLKQKFILYLLYVLDKTEIEVAEIMAVSRQRVNKIKRDVIILIMEKYMPLIRKYSSFEDTQSSEDCRQYIMMNLVIAIERFKPAIGCLCDDKEFYHSSRE